MGKALLDIIIVNYNTADFIGISLYALKKLTRNSYQVFIRDNNSKLEDYLKLKKIVKNYNNVFLERVRTKLGGSMAHGTALNALVKKVDTPYFSILDADAIWLKKNWDQILISKINNKVKAIGTQASGNKPQDFPLMYAILFETKAFNELGINFRPADVVKLQDTGYELREKYLRVGYRGINLEMRNTRVYKKGLFKDLMVAEYYLGKGHYLFASHFGRGSTLGANKHLGASKRYLYRVPVLGRHFLYKKGKREKEKWIRICKEIVDKQISYAKI